MEFQLTQPCDNCPFRSDVVPYLNQARAEEIALQLERHTFACHKTTHVSQGRDVMGRFAKRITQHCAGALILMLKTECLGDLQQIAERLGLFDPKLMKLDAPVVETFQQFIAAQPGMVRSRRRRVWYDA